MTYTDRPDNRDTRPDEKIGQSQPVPLGQRAESQLSCLLYRDRLNTPVQTNRSVINHNLGTWGHLSYHIRFRLKIFELLNRLLDQDSRTFSCPNFGDAYSLARRSSSSPSLPSSQRQLFAESALLSSDVLHISHNLFASPEVRSISHSLPPF